MSTVVPLGGFFVFDVSNIVHGDLFNLLWRFFGRPVRVWLRHIYLMTISEG